jgi:hypothetical protein
MGAIAQPCQRDLDLKTAELIIDPQLKDTEALFSSSKGKQRQNEVSDAELALQLYKQELENSARLILDRRMTQSIAHAVHNDGLLLQRTLSEEDIALRDRAMAQPHTTKSNASTTAAPNSNPIGGIDDETFAKLRALYVSGVDGNQGELDGLGEDEKDCGHAESSAWVGSRPSKTSSLNDYCHSENCSLPFQHR